MFKVITLAGRNADKPVAACGLFQDRQVDNQISTVVRGVPRTGGEWTALVKIASGETDIPDACRVRLIELGLIQEYAGNCDLTRHGRLTLGLPD